MTNTLLLGDSFDETVGVTCGKENIILFETSMVYNKQKKNSVKESEEEKGLGNVYLKKDHYLKYFEPKFNDSSEVEEKLFEFINQIGAYFIFVFLFEMSGNDSIMECKEKASKGIDLLDGALNRMHSRLYYEFVEKFYDISPSVNQMKEIDNYLEEHKLPKNDFVTKKTLLFLSFFHMYPNICHKLSNMTEDLEEDIKFYNKKRNRSLKRFIEKKHKI